MLTKEIIKRFRNKEKILKKEEDWVWKKIRDDNDYLAQKKAKDIDFKVSNWIVLKIQCVSCPKQIYYEEAQWCHWIDKWSKWGWNYWCRWQEWNIRAWCIKCNNYNKESHQRNFTVYQVKKYGKERVDEMLQETFKVHKNPSLYDILEANDFLRERHWLEKIWI